MTFPESTTTTTTSSNTSSSSPCGQCAKLLQEVLLESKDSRAMTILKAMGAKLESKTDSGVVVEIPARASSFTPSLLRRWSKLHRSTSSLNSSTDDPFLSASQLATSATRPSNQNDNAAIGNSSSFLVDKKNDKRRPLMERLAIICRPCSDSGPEGASRAFVMGPSPLSVVVCSNRVAKSSSSSSSSSTFSSSSLLNPFGFNASNHDKEKLQQQQQQADIQKRLQQRAEMEQVLVHELMHIYDIRTQRLDLRECETLAYSEVRAAREAECFSPPPSTNNSNNDNNASSWWSSTNQNDKKESSCVPQMALLATANIFPYLKAKACLDKVYQKAMMDTKPFGKNAASAVPKEKTTN